MTGAGVGDACGGGGGAQSRGSLGDSVASRQGKAAFPYGPSKRGRSLLVVAALTLAAVGSLSCKKALDPGRPVATLADTAAASRAFERERAQWLRNDPGERPQFRRDLDAFVKAFPGDNLAVLARIYAVLTLMEPAADWVEAERRLDALPLPPAGASQDLYVVAIAKLRRYHHQPEVAFELLRPLVGSIVGARARSLLQEELTFDALESRQPYEAVAYMDAWLRGASEEDRQTSEAKVAVALGAVPEEALRGSLTAMRAGRKSHTGTSVGYGEVIERLVAERLGQIAVERGDASLARWLLDSASGEPLLGEEVSGTLGQLATSRRGIGTVAGRTVGLVLPTSSDALRDEVADVVRGVLWALDIGRDDPAALAASGAVSKPDAIRLVTRDDGGQADRLRAAMEEVAGEGASVIITALDPDAAAEAAQWAAETSINVIVLAAPALGGQAAGKKGVVLESTAFSVGEDWTSELKAVAEALGATPGSVATVGDSESLSSVGAAARKEGAVWQVPLSCDLAPTRAGDSRFPLGAWDKAGVRRWLVAGSTQCAADVLAGLGQGSRTGQLGLALEASDLPERPRPTSGLRLVAATAGIVPLALASPTDPRVKDALSMVQRTGAREGWWTAVAHDAAALARVALAKLPDDTVSDAESIADRRAFVRRGLVEGRAPLWTSERQGFDAARNLPRTIRAVELVRNK